MIKKAMAGIVNILAAICIISGITITGCTKTGNDTIKLTGTVETTVVEVSFKISGRLLERAVDEGQQAKSGQIVARLENDELNDEKELRLADQRAALATLDDLKAGSRREEIAAVEAAFMRLRAEAERADRDAVRAEALYKKEVIPRRELDAARATKEATAAAMREGQERLNLARSGPRPDVVKQAKARLDAAGALLALSDRRLSQSLLAAPVSGTVLSKHAEPGEMLAAGSPVITVGNLDDVWVRAYIPETQLARIKTGQSVQVTCDTWKGRRYKGVVSFIASEAEFTPRNVQTEAERVKLVYRIKINIANPEHELKPGMPVDAVIETGTGGSGS